MKANRFRRTAPALLIAALLHPAAAPAYPGAPASWLDWQTKAVTSVAPRQLAAISDPDGRLRLAFVNSNQSAVLFGATRHPVEFLSFTRFALGLPSDRLIIGKASTDTFPSVKDPAVADTLPTGTPGRQRVGLALGKEENGFRPAYGWLGRGVSGSLTFWAATTGRLPWFPRVEQATGPALLTLNPTADASAQSVAANRTLTARLGTRTETISSQAQLVIQFQFDLALAATPGQETTLIPLTLPASPWPLSRSCDGVHIAMNEPVPISGDPSREECDLYVALSTRKPNGNQTEYELRLFRVRINYLIANPAALSAVTAESRVVATGSRTGSDFPGFGGFPYPKVLVSSNRSPLWVIWEEGNADRIRGAKRGGFPTIAAELANSYDIPTGLAGNFAIGGDPDAALDRLDRLHLVWRQTGTPDFCRYARENAAGGFDPLTIGVCSGAPTVAVGPGEYPWIAYPGDADAGASLVIRYPRGLMDSYLGDFEDRDGDLRPGLLEKALGTSDTVKDFPYPPMVVSIVGSGGTRRARLNYTIDSDAVRVGTTTRYTLADGNDTLEISPAFSVDLKNWSGTGFDFVSAINFPSLGRGISLDDQGILSFYPAQSYRLNVKRIPGAP